MAKDNLIQQKSFDFAILIVKLYQKLIKQHEYVLSKQLLRSATSIGANIEEALAGYSRKDFIYKMTISTKEARETRYWLRLIQHSELTDIDLGFHLQEIEQIINILSSIIKTSRENNP